MKPGSGAPTHRAWWRVLNKQTNISPEAREKVLRAIEELQYQPNKLARALTSSGFDA
ncbi:LacI family DNA-binding transcriptional regulator, partial [Escherichia coli]